MASQESPNQPDRHGDDGADHQLEPAALGAKTGAATMSRALHEVWSIAWPTVLTMTSYTVMQFIDKLMLGQVSPLAVAAQGNGGIWAFIPIAIAMGVLTVVNTYVSQNLGAGKPREGPKYAWGAMWISLAAWVLVFIPLALLMPIAFESMRGYFAGSGFDDPATIDDLLRMQSTYGQILLFGGVLTIAGRGLHHFFFGMHRPKLVAIAAVAGNCTNVVANYILIFGEAGIESWGLPGIPGTPAMGLAGAAIGTVLGGLVEFVIPLVVFLGPKLNAELATRSHWRPRLGPIKDLWRIGWPAAVQYGNELICWALFMSVLVGYFGTEHVTAGWIALTYMHLSFMPAVGFSVAATSLVGKYIGAGTPDVAVLRARMALGMAMVYMTICALVFFVFRAPLVSLFVGGDVTAEQAEQIISIGSRLMICAAFFQTVDAIGITYTGALRGAGDTVWPGVITMIYSWLFIVGGGALLIVLAPGLTSVGPWIGASLYIVLFGLTMGWRFESRKWQKIKLLGPTERAAAKKNPIGTGAPATIPDASVRDIAEDIAESIKR